MPGVGRELSFNGAEYLSKGAGRKMLIKLHLDWMRRRPAPTGDDVDKIFPDALRSLIFSSSAPFSRVSERSFAAGARVTIS